MLYIAQYEYQAFAGNSSYSYTETKTKTETGWIVAGSNNVHMELILLFPLASSPFAAAFSL